MADKTHTEWSRALWSRGEMYVDDAGLWETYEDAAEYVQPNNASTVYEFVVRREVTDWVPEDPAERRKITVKKAREALEGALHARFENGDSVFEYILATRPDLKKRLIDWMSTDPREGAVNVD